MKKAITCLLLASGLTGHLSAQTPVQDRAGSNEGKVIQMDKQKNYQLLWGYNHCQLSSSFPKRDSLKSLWEQPIRLLSEEQLKKFC